MEQSNPGPKVFIMNLATQQFMSSTFFPTICYVPMLNADKFFDNGEFNRQKHEDEIRKLDSFFELGLLDYREPLLVFNRHDSVNCPYQFSEDFVEKFLQLYLTRKNDQLSQRIREIYDSIIFNKSILNRTESEREERIERVRQCFEKTEGLVFLIHDRLQRQKVIKEFDEKYNQALNLFQLNKDPQNNSQLEICAKIFLNCLILCIRIYGENHHRFISTLYSLGSVYFHQSRFEEAFIYLKRANEIAIHIGISIQDREKYKKKFDECFVKVSGNKLVTSNSILNIPTTAGQNTIVSSCASSSSSTVASSAYIASQLMNNDKVFSSGNESISVIANETSMSSDNRGTQISLKDFYQLTKLNANEDKFIYVTQDGAAVLLKNKVEHIKGLYTENLQTCIAIIAFGVQGTALIHDTGRLSVESISEVFKPLGAISKIYLCYNPHLLYKDKTDVIKTGILKIVKKFSSSVNYIKCENGYIGCVRDRQNELLCFPERDPMSFSFLFPIHRHVRNWINTTNNYFLKLEKEMVVDIQFDGLEFKPLPCLIKTPKQISKEKSFFMRANYTDITERMIKVHFLLWQELNQLATQPILLRINEFKKVNVDDFAINDFEQWLLEQDSKVGKTENRNNQISQAATDSTLKNDDSDKFKEEIKRIVPNKNWKFPLGNKIWLQLEDKVEAEFILNHFKANGYQNITLSFRKDSPTTPIIVLNEINYNILIKMPTISSQINEQKSVFNNR